MKTGPETSREKPCSSKVLEPVIETIAELARTDDARVLLSLQVDRRGSVISGKLQKIGQEPPASFALLSGVISGMRSRHSSGAPAAVADARKTIASPAAAAAAASAEVSKVPGLESLTFSFLSTHSIL